MGTNFYWHENPPCPHCGHQPEGIHIGKSSGGWCFSLHVYPEDGINTLEDWQSKYESSGEIRDEYGDAIHPKDMTNWIVGRGWTPREGLDADFYRLNHAEPGPNNLVRHQIDGKHCIGHGAGTWDYCVGWFS